MDIRRGYGLAGIHPLLDDRRKLLPGEDAGRAWP